MITAVDTSVLLDIFLPDPLFGKESLARLKGADSRGALVICGITYAELSPHFTKENVLQQVLLELGMTVVHETKESLYNAGQMWSLYRTREKKRDRILPDFIIGSFSLHQADALLTRDRGYYRDYFSGLKLME